MDSDGNPKGSVRRMIREMEATQHRNENSDKITTEQKTNISPRTRDKKSSLSSSSSSAQRPIESGADESDNKIALDKETTVTLSAAGKDEHWEEDLSTKRLHSTGDQTIAPTSGLVCRLLETSIPSSADIVGKPTVLKQVAPTSDSRDASTEHLSMEVIGKLIGEKTVKVEYVMEIANTNGYAAEKWFVIEKAVFDNVTTAPKGSHVCDVIAPSDVENTQKDALDGGVLETPLHRSSGSKGQQAPKARRPGLLLLRTDNHVGSANIDGTETRKCLGSPLDANTTIPDSEINKVELPLRYRKRIPKSRDGDKENEENDLRLPGDKSQLKSIIDHDSSQVDQEEGETRENRERDMRTAFEWAEQELRLMKEDDRRLARQLLELRASLHQMRGLTDCQSFTSDEYDLDPDWSSSRSLNLEPALTVHSSSSVQGRIADLGMRTPSELVNSDSLLSTRHAIRQEFYV